MTLCQGEYILKVWCKSLAYEIKCSSEKMVERLGVILFQVTASSVVRNEIPNH